MLARLTFRRFVAGLVLLGAATLACVMPAQNDTWWHLRAGYEMLSTGQVLLVDTFSHSISGRSWPNYEWLTQVVFAALHRAGGMPLLTLTCAASIVAGLAAVYATLRGDIGLKAMLLAGVIAGSTLTWSLRPQAFTLGLLGLTIWLVDRRKWVLLPPVFLVWANLHGAVALGGLLLCGIVLGHLWHERRVPGNVAAAVTLCAITTLLTPLGLDYWPEIAASIRRSRINDIAEWRPPEWPPSHLIFWAAAATMLILLTARRERLTTAVDKGFAVAGLLALLLAMRSMRNISPFLMLAAPVLSRLVAPGTPARAGSAVAPGRGLAHAVVLLAAVVLAARFVAEAWEPAGPRGSWGPITPRAGHAIAACRGPLYNRYVDGGPLVFFVPSQPVLLDSRQDPYPISLVTEQDLVERTGAYERLFEHYGINCAAVPPHSPTRPSLERDGWLTRFADDAWVVLERPAAAAGSAR